MEARLKLKVVVISAVNFSDGGPLTVLRDCLDSASRRLDAEWTIVALVHRRDLISNPRIRCIEYPASKNSWFARLRLEWVKFHALSLELNPSLWLSLHDITPRVVATRQVVYCHNPAPFYQLTLKEMFFEPKFLLFNLFYRHLYRINIRRNVHVVVQQEWIRAAFRKLYGHISLIVAHPEQALLPTKSTATVRIGKTIFFYPALARVFKNFEVLCHALESLPRRVSDRIELRLTIDGTENRYSRHLVRRFGSTQGICFIGRQSSDAMRRLYEECDMVLFPSKLETWGLPISEAKSLGKPLLVADLPYARETVGEYEAVSFLPTDSVKAWREALEATVEGKWLPAGSAAFSTPQPFSRDWTELWSFLTNGL